MIVMYMDRAPEDFRYHSIEGYELVRDRDCVLPSGVKNTDGHWVLYAPGRIYVDWDRYRFDIAERHDLDLTIDK